MSNIRSKAQKPKTKRKGNKESIFCCSEQYPWLSFRYMTSSAKHSIKFLDSLGANDRDKTLALLYHRLEEISKQPWQFWMLNQKNIGLETLEYQDLTFTPGCGLSLAKDTTMYVFRCDTYIGGGKGRIIRFKISPCSAYHIVGYDFDFSAYNHGS